MDFHAGCRPLREVRTMLSDKPTGATRHEFDATELVSRPLHQAHARAAASEQKRADGTGGAPTYDGDVETSRSPKH